MSIFEAFRLLFLTDPRTGLHPLSHAALTAKGRKGRIKPPKRDPRPKRTVYTENAVGKAGLIVSDRIRKDARVSQFKKAGRK